MIATVSLCFQYLLYRNKICPPHTKKSNLCMIHSISACKLKLKLQKGDVFTQILLTAATNPLITSTL